MGIAWQSVKKALRVRRKMFALAKAKENAIRELAGYPPLRTWWESCVGGCWAALGIVCRAFCPCLLIRFRFWFKSFFCPRTTCCGRCFYDGEYENEVLKNILGFAFGMGLTVLFYTWLCVQKDYPRIQAAVVSCVVGVILTLGLALAARVRCLVFLTLPSMFTKRGRTALLLYGTVLVFSYPAANISANFQVIANSATCGQSLMLNETRKLIQMVKQPLSAVIDTLQEMYKRIKIFATSLLNAFETLIRAIKEIASTIAAVFKWLYSLVDICNEEMGRPYRRCKEAFDNAHSDCRRRLGWFFGWMCGIVQAASNLCHIARIGELLCVVAAAIKKFVVSTVMKATVGSVKDLKEMFWFDIKIERRYTYSMNQTRSYSEVKEAILAEIKAKLSIFSGLFTWVDNVMMFTVFYVVFKAWRYRSGYLTKDEYDNCYITDHVYAIEEKRRELKRPTIFPLKAAEKSRYIPLSSVRLTRSETRKLLRGLIWWGLATYNAIFYMVTDYGFFWILAMVSRHLNFKTTASLPPFMQLRVRGEGPVADMYRTMVGLLDPLAESGLDIDTKSCLPFPSPPDFEMYRLIVAIYIICLFLAVFEAYGLRLRRAVAACYYPHRERQRAVWLYNQILFRRGALHKFIRRQIRRKYKDDKEIVKMSIRGRLMRQFPCLTRLVKLCGYDYKNCIACGQEGRPEDTTSFTHCINYGCTAIYCNECFDDLNNLCTICLNPVDYGDLSDLSEEVDSSEDEDISELKKHMAAKRREEARERKEKKKPKYLMKRFMGAFSIPKSAAELIELQKSKGKVEEETPMLSEDDTSVPTTSAGKAFSGSEPESEDSSEDVSDEDLFDSSYQYANKSDIPTSSADDSSNSASESMSPENRNQNTALARRRPPQYETVEIFNVETTFTVNSDREYTRLDRSSGSHNCRGRPVWEI